MEREGEEPTFNGAPGQCQGLPLFPYFNATKSVVDSVIGPIFPVGKLGLGVVE